MSRVWGITFTDDNMTTSAALCVQSMLSNNVSKATIYQPHDIPSDFAPDIMSETRGPSYWCWKSWTINHHLKTMPENDYLLYCDAGIEVINNVNYLTDRCENIFLFTNGHTHLHWCKRDIIDRVLGKGWNDESAKQVQASAMVVKNTTQSRVFVHDWLRHCQCKELIDDSPSIAPNHPEFRENRHDQAILTTLAIRDGIKLNWWPAVYNGHVFQGGGEHPAIFNHHYKRNPGKGNGRPEW